MKVRKWLSLIAVLALVVGIGAKIATDPEVQKIVSPYSFANRPAAARPTTAVSTTTTAPAYAIAYARAFCAADAPTLAATTSIDGINEAYIAQYFANDPAVCSGFTYLGGLNDGGVERYIFVLSYPADRQDWVVLSFGPDHKANGLKRG